MLFFGENSSPEFDPLQSVSGLFSNHSYSRIDIVAVFVSRFGVIYVIGGNHQIKQKLHLLNQVSQEKIVTRNEKREIRNLIQEAETQFEPIRLKGPDAVVVLSYCFRVISEVSNDYHPEIRRLLLLSGPTFFLYGAFKAAPKMTDNLPSLSGKMRSTYSNEKTFEVFPQDKIEILGRVHIRVTGTRNLIYVTRTLFQNGTVDFHPPRINQPLNPRRFEFEKWLDQCNTGVPLLTEDFLRLK